MEQHRRIIDQWIKESLDSFKFINAKAYNEFCEELKAAANEMNLESIALSAKREDYLNAVSVMPELEKKWENVDRRYQQVKQASQKAAEAAVLGDKITKALSKTYKYGECIDFKVDDEEKERLQSDFKYVEDQLKQNLQHENAQVRELTHETLVSLSTTSFQKQYEYYKNKVQEIKRLDEEKSSVYEKYYALCALNGEKPKLPTEFAMIETLNGEISFLEEKYRKRDEMDFIAQQINEAMEELGYNLLSSRTFIKNGTEIERSVYNMDEDSGIAVYTSESGKVEMKMVIFGDDDVITKADRDVSLKKQISFCTRHPDIVAALRKRGVILKQRNYRPPDQQYTQKLIRSQNGAITKPDRRKRRINGQKVLQMPND